MANKPFDVFLSHNSKDKTVVRELTEALRQRGLKVWLDEEQLIPGRPWQEALEDIIKSTRTAALLIGKDGVGPWEKPEMRACLSEFVDRQLPVIPVILPNAPRKLKLPLFLKAFTWVDLRGVPTEQGLDQLEWGITGKKPIPRSGQAPTPPRPIWPWVIAGFFGLAIIIVAVWWLSTRPNADSMLTLARHSMSSGRYADAIKHYQQALDKDANNQNALFGKQKAMLAENITHAAHDNPVDFSAELKTLQQDHPDDADLLMLEGDLLYRDPLPQNQALAESKYLEASNKPLKSAEVLFRLGVLNTRKGQLAAALRNYQDAAKLEPEEKYFTNMAETYLLQGEYKQAIPIYDNLDEYPLGQLESAKASWALSGQLRLALDKQSKALRWLADPKVAELPKNQIRWRLETSPKGDYISVTTPACKQYYAALAQAASRFMLEGNSALPEPGLCPDGNSIKQVVAEDLRRYAQIQAEQVQASQSFMAKLSVK